MNVHYPIRVVARVRPSLLEDDETCMQVASAASQIVLGFDNFYDFDAVFGEDVSQNDFYETCFTDIVSNFFHGYNTTVLSYGQQGAGKTYTMNGPNFIRTMNEEEFGLLPRAVRDIFKMMNHLPNREYRVHISYLIIHQESVYDLLSNGLSSLNVLEDNGGNVIMPGMTVVDCHSISDVLNCLEEGLLVRHSASNQGFDLSSAHTMFNLTLEHQWTEPNGKLNYIYSRLNFVDLAGSEENLSITSNEMGGFSNFVKGNFLLNSDLKAFSNVICSLTNKNHAQMVPYRASRLTHLLKDSLGGNSLTLMVSCLSPSAADFDASFNTMKLGCLTRYVINYPRLNLISQSAANVPSGTPNVPSGIPNAPSGTPNANNVWSSSSTRNGSTSVNHQSIESHCPNMTALPQLSQGLPPNLQVVQASLEPTEPSFNNAHEEVKSQKNNDIFKVQFAASQLRLLVAHAEDLLAEFLHIGSLSPLEKSRIESWLCMKAETDECISQEAKQIQTPMETNRLEVIEELSEPSEMNDSISSLEHFLEESEVSSSVSSLGENFYDQLDQLKEKFLSMTSDLIREVEKKQDICDSIPTSERPENATELLREKIKNMNVSTKTEEMELVQQDDDDDEEKKFDDEEKKFLRERNRENSELDNYGSDLSLISGRDRDILGSSPTPTNSPTLKRKTNKTRRKMVEKFNGFILKNKMQQQVVASSSDFISGDDDDSSGNELLRRVSLKLVSVSKGSSKCVSNLKSKSFQLKKSIRSRIFKKCSKMNQGMILGVENPKFSYSSESKPYSVRIVRDELRDAQQQLEILSETIKAKEELVAALRQTEPEAETMRKKCLIEMRKCEFELKTVKEQYENVQKRHHDIENVVEDKEKYRREIQLIEKKLISLQKVSTISAQDDSKVRILQESINDLREKREELQTKFREELQRKQLLERQILREDRCSRNPISTSKLLDDDESEDIDMEDVKSSPVNLETVQSKKRKLVNSTGDSQSETHSSWRGKGRRKAGRLDTGGSSDREVNLIIEDPQNINRRHINILRTAKEKLIAKRQRMDKRIRKGVCTESDARKEERKLLELDEAVEGLDAVIELKNLIITGNLTSIQPYSPLLAKIDLEETFRALPSEEIHFILIKYFDRLIDLRIEFRKQELDYAELENLYDKQNRDMRRLKAAYQQASLQVDRKITSIQREYQKQISYLLQELNKDSSGIGVNVDLMKKMEQQVYYYKDLSRQFKEKLKQYQGHSRVIDPGPGPSGIRNRSYQDPQYGGKNSQLWPATPWTTRDRRNALSPLIKVTREKNKLIIQQ